MAIPPIFGGGLLVPHQHALANLIGLGEFSPLQMGNDTLIGAGLDLEGYPCLSNCDILDTFIDVRLIHTCSQQGPSCRIPIFRNKWDCLDCQKYLSLCLGNKVATNLGRVDIEARGVLPAAHRCVCVLLQSGSGGHCSSDLFSQLTLMYQIVLV